METRKIVFDDGGRASVKVGTFEKEDELFIYLKQDNDVTNAIAKSKIIRQEISGA